MDYVKAIIQSIKGIQLPAVIIATGIAISIFLAFLAVVAITAYVNTIWIPPAILFCLLVWWIYHGVKL